MVHKLLGIFNRCSYEEILIDKHINSIARISIPLMFNSGFSIQVRQFHTADSLATTYVIYFSVVFIAVHLNAFCIGAVFMNMPLGPMVVCILS